MKNLSYSAVLCILSFIMIDSSSATGYLTPTITEYDMVGCKKHSHDPRCKQVIKVGCNSICVGHEKESSDFGRACKDLCLQFKLKNETTLNKEQNNPKPRH